MDGWGQSKIAKDVGNSKVGGDFTLTPEFLGDFTLTPEFLNSHSRHSGLDPESSGQQNINIINEDRETRQRRRIRGIPEQHPQTKMVELLLPDVNGILRGKRIGTDELETLYRRGLKACASTPLVDSRGEVPFDIEFGTRDGDPDIMAHPVAGSLAPAPWLGDASVAQALVSLRDLEGDPWYADPRHVLARTHEKLRESGLRAVIATEFEFYLLEAGEGATPQPWLGSIPGTNLKQEGLQYGAMEDLWECDAFLTDVQRYCEAQNVPANTALPEFAPGQFEINLHHEDDPVRACDHGALLKRIIKGTAFKHGLARPSWRNPLSNTPAAACTSTSACWMNRETTSSPTRPAGPGPPFPPRCGTPSAACNGPWPRPWQSSRPTPTPTGACNRNPLSP